MRKAAGIILETNLATGKVKEYESWMCRHCNRHVIAWKYARDTSAAGSHFCTCCGGVICDRCAALGDCDPLEKKIARWHEQEHFRLKMREW